MIEFVLQHYRIRYDQIFTNMGCLDQEVKDSDVRHCMIGESNGAPMIYRVLIGNIYNAHFSVGIMMPSYSEAAFPCFLKTCSNQHLFCGCAKVVFRLDTDKYTVCKSMTTESDVYILINLQNQEGVLVICECDVYLLGYEIDIVWHASLNDMISSWQLTSSSLVLSLFEGGEKALLLTSGKEA